MPRARKRVVRVRELNPYGPKALALARKKAKKLWYAYIHSTSERCDARFTYTGCDDVLQGAHVFGKGAYRAVEFDPENGRRICRAHHFYFHKHPLEWEDSCRLALGHDKYEALRRRALSMWVGGLSRGPDIYDQIAVLEKLLDKSVKQD